jgi:hypothetical protein
MTIEWQVEIRKRPAQFLSDIFIYRRVYGAKIAVWRNIEGDIAQETEFDIGALVPPSFTVPDDFLPLLLDALLAKNIKPTEQSFVEGKLEATNEHLKDLRTLLKLK